MEKKGYTTNRTVFMMRCNCKHLNKHIIENCLPSKNEKATMGIIKGFAWWYHGQRATLKYNRPNPQFNHWPFFIRVIQTGSLYDGGRHCVPHCCKHSLKQAELWPCYWLWILTGRQLVTIKFQSAHNCLSCTMEFVCSIQNEENITIQGCIKFMVNVHYFLLVCFPVEILLCSIPTQHLLRLCWVTQPYNTSLSIHTFQSYMDIRQLQITGGVYEVTLFLIKYAVIFMDKWLTLTELFWIVAWILVRAASSVMHCVLWLQWPVTCTILWNL